MDNKWVVPYNPFLLLKYEGHCNVEYVNTVQSVKYLYKYVLKGPDKVHVEIIEEIDSDGNKKKIQDEIKQFSQGRYYDSSQSSHRLFGFSMSYSYPPVLKLNLHEEGQQMVMFEDDSNIYAKLEASERTSLTDFFRLNNDDPEANQHLYHEICRFYVWDKNKKTWYTRKQTMTKRNDDDEDPEGDGPAPLSEQIGRIPMVSLHPKCRERFFLRLLLGHVRGMY